eukprot:837528-Rhodomonas_salina.1
MASWNARGSVWRAGVRGSRGASSEPCLLRVAKSCCGPVLMLHCLRSKLTSNPVSGAAMKYGLSRGAVVRDVVCVAVRGRALAPGEVGALAEEQDLGELRRDVWCDRADFPQ